LVVLSILFSLYLLTKGGWVSRLGVSCLCLLLLLDLGSATYKSVRHDEAIFQRIEEIKKGLEGTLAADKTVYRVGSYKHALGPNLEMYLGFQTVGGFTALFPTRYYEYVNEYAEHQLPIGWESFTYGEAPAHTYMDLLNVKYGIMHSEKFYHVRETFLPRAFLVPDCKIMSKEGILRHIGSLDFEPMKLVLLEEPPKLTPAPSLKSVPKNESKEVKITSYRPDKISLVTEAEEPEFLFLSEIYYPGWKALVDDRVVPIQRGDYLFRVIQVPSGRHEVTFVFDPLSVKIGISATLLTLIFLLALAIYHSRKGKTFPLKER
jgi:Bacterial membrane protein YfhO